MKKNFSISVGDIVVKGDGNQYRLLRIDDYCTLIMMNIDRYFFEYPKKKEIIDNIAINKWVLVKDTTATVINLDNLPDNIIEKLEKDSQMCRSIVAEIEIEGYDSLFHSRKKLVQKWAEAYNVSEKKVRRVLRQYLQSGFDENSLVDKRCVFSFCKSKDGSIPKRGKQYLSDEDIKNMRTILDIYKRDKYLKVIDAYEKLLNDFYRYTPVENSKTSETDIRADAPSYNQFYYYIRTHMTDYQRDAKRMQYHEQRNNKRILTGSSTTGIRYPGEVVEIDECDFPVSLVSKSDFTQTIGRPNVYMMIDVLTHVICAVGIAFDQNSYVGLTNMFINLADDKVEYCKKYGIEIQPEDWYSNFIPARIRCDQGSDFKSEAIRDVCKRLNIERNLEPIATGSMKGEIENLFHLLQERMRPFFENKGLITKDYGSKHHKQACITLETFTSVLLLLIIEHNKKSMESYPMTDEMIAEGILPRPYMIWEYYCRKEQEPMPIRNKNKYLLALMKKGVAKVDRKGIHFLKRTYLFDKKDDPELWAVMYSNQNQKSNLDIYYDPRNMNSIYYLSSDTLKKLDMSKDKLENKGYFNKSEQEIMMLLKQENNIRKDEKDYNIKLGTDTAYKISEMMKAKITAYAPVATDMRENRHKEKHEVDKTLYDIQSRFEGDDKSVNWTAENAPEAVSDNALNQTAVNTDQPEIAKLEQIESTISSIPDYDTEMTVDDALDLLIQGQKKVNRL